jgi:hypothetical protein
VHAASDSTVPSRSALDRILFFRNEWVLRYRHPGVVVGVSFGLGAWNLLLATRLLRSRRWVALLPLAASALQLSAGFRLYQLRVSPGADRSAQDPSEGTTDHPGR